MTQRSARAFEEAQRVLVGGVNSPVRSFRGVGGTPVVFERGIGPLLFDVDGNEYIDFVASWGPLILGHAQQEVVEAIHEAAEQGTSFGAPTEIETEIASLICEAVPSVERVRMTNSGTEACLTAIRLARGFTGRPKIIKMIGCYHGHADSLLVRAGSGALTLGEPDSAGVTPGAVGDTLLIHFNDLAAAEQVFSQNRGQIAAVILEPVAGNMGVISPRPGYLDGLCELTKREGALLVLDEVMTGFRVAWSGAQSLFGVTPDLSCFGKVIGGGLPVGAVGGRAEIMERLAPIGSVYQAGTLSGNPLAMTAGLVTLQILQREGVYARLEELGITLQQALTSAAKEASVPLTVQRVGSMVGIFFTGEPVQDFTDVQRVNTERYAKFFHRCLGLGVYLPPSAYEALFVSLAHRTHELERTAEVFRIAMMEINGATP
jgi:glutamate-1-semialdehyde 2,1-aminomutase